MSPLLGFRLMFGHPAHCHLEPPELTRGDLVDNLQCPTVLAQPGSRPRAQVTYSEPFDHGPCPGYANLGRPPWRGHIRLENLRGFWGA